MVGFVLGGGGARGAYEAGVLRYLYGPFIKRTGIVPKPEVFCGTSIGALTATWAAALGADTPRHLTYLWQTLEPHHVYRVDTADLARTALRMLRQKTVFGEGVALFDPNPFYSLMQEVLPWETLYKRLDQGEVRTLVVAATEVASGRCIYFNDGPDRLQKATTTAKALPTRITAAHVLASAAIPFVFPAVPVEGRYYLDGGLRQNTPLSPAIELGVDRALVVSVRPGVTELESPNESPSLGFLAGRALEALLLDSVEENIRRVNAINKILDFGERTWPDFEEKMRSNHRPYRHVRTVLLRPSEDLSLIAAQAWKEAEIPWATRKLLGPFMDGGNAEFVSFLLFHHRYTGELEALGYSDTEKREESIAELLAE